MRIPPIPVFPHLDAVTPTAASNYRRLDNRRAAMVSLLGVCCVGGLLSPPTLASPKRLSAEKAALTIAKDGLRETTRLLADSKLAGRQLGSPGEREAQRYVKSRLQQVGLSGVSSDGYSQGFALTEVRSQQTGAASFRSIATTMPVQIAVGPAELVLTTLEPTAATNLRDVELLFVGYGITAPELQWDDYKGIDVRGKVVLVLDGDPQQTPGIFGGSARTLYGRWPYKVAEAGRHGAAGVLVVHDPSAAGHGFAAVRNAWAHQYYLSPEGRKEPGSVKLRGFLSDDACRRLLQAGGQDYDTQRRAAEDRSFNPLALPVRINVTQQHHLQPIQTANIIGILPGSDPHLRSEAVVYTAHLSHLGSHDIPSGAATIWNGARNGALGIAGLLELARAAAQGPPPRRTLIFAALATQQGDFAGATQLLSKLPTPVHRIIAHISLDMLSPQAASAQLLQVGRGRSSIDLFLNKVAKSRKRPVTSEPNPERGLYYRSDSLRFAEAGIPSLLLAPADLTTYLQQQFNQPSDTYSDAWTFEATAQDLQLLYLTGLQIAEAKTAPTFNANDEFAKPASNSRK